MFKVKTFYVIAAESGTAFYHEDRVIGITNDILMAKHFIIEEDAIKYKNGLADSRRWIVKKAEVYIV